MRLYTDTQDGVKYVKSVDYDKGTYELCSTKAEAKKYTNQYEAEVDIDVTIVECLSKGHIFMME